MGKPPGKGDSGLFWPIVAGLGIAAAAGGLREKAETDDKPAGPVAPETGVHALPLGQRLGTDIEQATPARATDRTPTVDKATRLNLPGTAEFVVRTERPLDPDDRRIPPELTTWFPAPGQISADDVISTAEKPLAVADNSSKGA